MVVIKQEEKEKNGYDVYGKHMALAYIDLVHKAHKHHQEELGGIADRLDQVKDRLSLIEAINDNLETEMKENFEANKATEIRLTHYKNELKELHLQFKRREEEEGPYSAATLENPISEDLLEKCMDPDLEITLTETEAHTISDALAGWADEERNVPRWLAEKHSELSSEYLATTITATNTRINGDNEMLLSKQLPR